MNSEDECFDGKNSDGFKGDGGGGQVEMGGTRGSLRVVFF